MKAKRKSTNQCLTPPVGPLKGDGHLYWDERRVSGLDHEYCLFPFIPRRWGRDGGRPSGGGPITLLGFLTYQLACLIGKRHALTSLVRKGSPPLRVAPLQQRKTYESYPLRVRSPGAQIPGTDFQRYRSARYPFQRYRSFEIMLCY